MTAFAFSLITNKCVTDSESHEEANHEDVVEVGKSRQALLAQIVIRMVQKINEEQAEAVVKNNNNDVHK